MTIWFLWKDFFLLKSVGVGDTWYVTLDSLNSRLFTVSLEFASTWTALYHLECVHLDAYMSLFWSHPNIQSFIVYLDKTQLSKWMPWHRIWTIQIYITGPIMWTVKIDNGPMDHLCYVYLDRQSGQQSNGPPMLH